MGQFSTEIYAPPGSTLSGNQQPITSAIMDGADKVLAIFIIFSLNFLVGGD